MKKVGNYKDMNPYYRVEEVYNVGPRPFGFPTERYYVEIDKRIQSKGTNTEDLRREQAGTSLTQITKTKKNMLWGTSLFLKEKK